MSETNNDAPEHVEKAARRACKEVFDKQEITPHLLLSSLNEENGHWQIHLVNGSWSGVKAGSKIRITNSEGPVVESCIVVLDGTTDEVLAMRDW